MISSPAEAAEVLRIEKQWAEDVLNGDTVGLNRILSDDLRYVHSNGSIETKQALLSAIRSGKTLYESIDSEDVDVRVIGEAAVVTSSTRLQVKVRGQEHRFQARFLRVYLKGNGSWRLAYHQGTRLS